MDADAEAAQIRDDIVVLQAMVDGALDGGGDRALFLACTQVLRERRARLEELETSADVSTAAVRETD
jgi:hypothetical protein